MQIATTKNMLTILESCQISPPPATIGNRSLPITFFDLIWLPHFPINQLFFYEFPHSRTRFIEKVVPNLKHSLSLTLQHFFPFASNLLVFPKPNDSSLARQPEIRYVEGDYVVLTFVECDHLDFDDLVGNHPRACDKFYPLVPSLGHVVRESDFMVIPLFAVQVTFYENRGFSIGITNHHVLCDASTKYDFLRAWTSIARHGTDELFLAKRSNLPVYDRLIKYPDSFDQMFIKESGVETLYSKYQLPELIGPSSKARSTFILTKAKINLIKSWVSRQVPTLQYVSSFSVACAYVWSCIAKSRAEVEGTKGEDELERFVCVANFRSRMDPPLPQTYFGNCVAPCVAITKSFLLSENNGFLVAVESLGEAISKTVKNKDELLKDDELWFEMLFKIPAKIPAKIGVAGTPKVKIYDIDFGWGKPKKYETISIDCNGSITVNACKESPNDLEIGLSLPDKQMNAFIAIFDRELQSFL
ncbi:malonyl-coenzyme A:anthocyanin 3-O-glucoside-6''-O-malonyltransferase-like protein [Tanacetum coccineum]|uniref:Malonyl-coenzyme A:anthocyanin 3-O-glucoside-6''-O-malonyltransferase-like protein n=1 Tax=Tanacetum coccineum TaxID=301880 RepID=A0ABQ4ZYD3_9ASTR